MRNAQDLNSVFLSNGLMIKGSYTHSQGGLHISLYLLNPTGRILANRTYGFSKPRLDPQVKMLTMLNALVQLCTASKLDAVTQPRIQEAGAKSLMLALTKDAVFKKAP